MTLRELKQYRALKRQVGDLAEKIEKLEKEKSSIRSPHGEAISDGQRKGLVDRLIKIEELQNELDRKRDQAIERYQKIENSLSEIDDIASQNILRRRYIDGDSLWTTSGKVGYSESQTTRLHDDCFELRKFLKKN